MTFFIFRGRSFGTREHFPCPSNLIKKAAASSPTIHKLNSGGQLSRKNNLQFFGQPVHTVIGRYFEGN